MTLERNWQKTLMKELNQDDDLWAIKTVETGRCGCPDILGVVRGGAFFAIEAKAKTGRVSPIQDYEISRIRAVGGHVRVCRSLDEARAFIEEVKSWTK